jgi:hypothetical protein
MACAKRLRSLSPDFETPIFYFKPYPGSAIVLEAVSGGFRLPQTLQEWSRFDYVAGEPGPWVTRATYELIERFKFFQRHAFRRGATRWDLLQRLSRYRCGKDDYRFPLEMVVMQWLQPGEPLS